MSERNHTQPVVGRARDHAQMWDDDTQPGDHCVDVKGDYILCECPCGCGGFMNLPIATGPKQERKWQWDGNRETPTLAPSIRDLSCGDSGA